MVFPSSHSLFSHIAPPPCPPPIMPACPCQNGGTCNTSSNTCTCPSGYSGNSCQTLTDCFVVIARVYETNRTLINPCLNGGTCATDTGKCQCTALYTGPSCETSFSPCSNFSPCKNGASCTDTLATSSGYSCACATGYSGVNCTTIVDLCSSNPCTNGGTCSQPAPGQFSCSCPAGYTGTRCETVINNCLSSPCLNGGTCTNAVNNYSCSCAPGYFGRRCENGMCSGKISPCGSESVDLFLYSAASDFPGRPPFGFSFVYSLQCGMLPVLSQRSNSVHRMHKQTIPVWHLVRGPLSRRLYC